MKPAGAASRRFVSKQETHEVLEVEARRGYGVSGAAVAGAIFTRARTFLVAPTF